MRSDDGGDSKDMGGGATNAPLLMIAHKLLAKSLLYVCYGDVGLFVFYLVMTFLFALFILAAFPAYLSQNVKT